MRRPIDSDYLRKKRLSRRSRDNWRPTSKVKHVHKYGGKKMFTDKQIWIIGFFLSGVWLLLTSWLLWEAFK